MKTVFELFTLANGLREKDQAVTLLHKGQDANLLQCTWKSTDDIKNIKSTV